MTRGPKWNLLETIYFLCTLEHRDLPGNSELIESLTAFEDVRKHGLFRSVFQALVDLFQAIENRQLSVAGEVEPDAALARDLRSLAQNKTILGPVDPEDLLEIADLQFYEEELRRVGRAIHISPEAVLDEFEKDVKGRRWLELHHAARLVLITQPNGQQLNAFAHSDGWQYHDHPEWLQLFSENGALLHHDAKLRWETITTTIVELMLSGKLVAESNGKPIPPSLWQNSHPDWWSSQLIPMPIVRTHRFGIPELDRSSLKNRQNPRDLLINRGQLEDLLAAGRFNLTSMDEVERGATPSNPRAVQRPSDVAVERQVRTIHQTWISPHPPSQAELKRLVAGTLPKVTRSQVNAALKLVFYKGADLKRGPRVGSKRG